MCTYVSTVCMESLYLHLGIGPARDLYDHVEDSFLSISVKRNVVEWRHNTIAILCLVCAEKEEIAATEAAVHSLQQSKDCCCTDRREHF